MNDQPIETPQTTQTERVYTQEEVDALMARQQQALAEALAQVEALTAQLNDCAQRTQEDEASARERQIQRREMHAQAVEHLAAQQLPVQLADALDYTDAQRFEASLEAMAQRFAQAVQRSVEMRLRGTAPTVGTSAVKPATLREAIERRYAGV